MKFNLTELEIFAFIAKNVEIRLADIHIVSKSLTSTYLNNLKQRGFLEKKTKKFLLSSQGFSRILANLLADDPTIKHDLINESIPILVHLVNKPGLTISEIGKETGIPTSSIYPYIRRFFKRQILIKEGKKLFFNKKLWGSLFQFINQYNNYYSLQIFNQVPKNAKIYFESPYELIFSVPNKLKKAIPTAFTVFNKYGIKLREREFFYRCDHPPKCKLNIQIILTDALLIAGAKNHESARRRLYCYVFYRKNVNFLKKVKNADLEILRRIVSQNEETKKINFPTITQIKEMCDYYDIKI